MNLPPVNNDDHAPQIKGYGVTDESIHLNEKTIVDDGGLILIRVVSSSEETF